MVYMGSKNKIVSSIIPIINNYIKENNIKTFVDPFCGGANVADKIECNEIICSDLSPTLIALHKQAQDDFSLIPEDGSRDYWDNAYKEYKRLRETNWENPEIPLYEIGAIEWYSSYARGGFPRGYAKTTPKRNYFKEARRNHYLQSQSENYKKIKFSCCDYRKIEIEPNSLIYLDPPYKNTKPYGICNNFNYEELYNWIKEKAITNPIFISEQNELDGFDLVWSKDGILRSMSKDNYVSACEKLYFIDKRLL